MNAHQNLHYRLLLRDHLALRAGTYDGQELPGKNGKIFKFIKIKWKFLWTKWFRASSDSKYG